jgi:hypothetical protein
MSGGGNNILVSLEVVAAGFRCHADSSIEVTFDARSKRRHATSGLVFEHFTTLYETMVKSSEAGVLVALPQENVVTFYFDENVEGRYSGGNAVYTTKFELTNMTARCPDRRVDVSFGLVKHGAMSSSYKPTTAPIVVRVAEVWSFVYNDQYKYVFEKVCEGMSQELACRRQPSYTVKLCVMNNAKYQSINDNRTVAKSVLNKAIDLLGRYEADGTKSNIALFPSNTPNWVVGARKKRKRKRVPSSSSSSSTKTTKTAAVSTDVTTTAPVENTPALSSVSTTPTVSCDPLNLTGLVGIETR